MPVLQEQKPVIDARRSAGVWSCVSSGVWASLPLPRLYRGEELKRRLTIDPHSPAKARTNVVLSNIPAFYEAFDVQPGDGMYIAPETRVKIW